ncbi:MAG: hypothetical protein LBJ88_01265 [Campylobacteraceae bacterium]|jgi:hypothetical protein|nr:hypothetical protein [Campylobacteraceae bacterium]
MEIKFDRKFCDLFEYEICRYFENNHNENTKGFWCDGVIFEWADEKMAYFRIFIGKTGQTEYKLTLNIGEKTLLKYKKDLAKKTWFLINENKVDIDLRNKNIIMVFE